MKAFISRTFRAQETEQSEAADYFTDLVRTIGVEPIIVLPEVGRLAEQILEQVRQCELAIGIFTRRHKLEGENGWTVPPCINSEMGIARSLGLPVAGFLQEGVLREQLGILYLEGWNILPFRHKTMYKPLNRKKFLDYLATLLPEAPSLTTTYRFSRFEKQIEIFPNGYGLVTHRCRLQVLDKNFRKVVHLLRLAESAGKDVTLPGFKELRSGSPSNLWKREPFFAFRILDPKSSTLSSLNIDLQPTENCDEEQIEFEIVLGAEPERDFVLNYEWTVGCPDLFPTSKAGLAPGLRKVDQDSCFSSLVLGHGGIEDFSFKLVFHSPISFERPPSLQVRDSAGNLPPLIGGSFDVTKSTTRETFISTKMNLTRLAAGKVVADWIPA